MPRLSVLIPPIQGAESGLATLIGVLLADVSLDLEIITLTQGGLPASEDARLTVLPSALPGTPQQAVWSTLVKASTGDWVTLVNPDDMLEPELAIMVDFVAQANPAADALSWHTLQIDANDPPDRRFSVGVPSQYSILNIDKTAMLKAFFMWENSLNVPRMPFGLHHGALKRALALTIAESLDASGRISPLPAAEWSARTLFLANEIALCERPMSVIARQPFAFDPAGVPSPGFPFHAGIGETAGIAEVQNAVFMEMGAPWGPEPKRPSCAPPRSIACWRSTKRPLPPNAKPMTRPSAPGTAGVTRTCSSPIMPVPSRRTSGAGCMATC